MRLSELLFEEHHRKRSKVSLAVLTYDGKVLILKRVMNDNDRNGGRWGFPGGGVEEGENPLEAVIRECEEEIGVTPIGLKKIDRNGRITWFMGELPASPEKCVRLNGEHDDWVMVGRDDLDDYDMIEGMKGLISYVVS